MQKYLLIAFWPFQSAKMSGSWTSVPSNSSTQETRELLFSNRSLSPALLWWRSGGGGGGVRCPVSLLFLLSGNMHTTGSLSHRTQASMMPPCFFFAPCPPQSQPPHTPPWSATWVMTTPGTLSPRCHFCHWINCWLQLSIPCLLFSAHVLTLNCLENKKRSWGSYEKRK